MKIDPEFRRCFLEEIAFQRTVRDTWARRELDQTTGPIGAAHARHRADTARYAIRALQDVHDAMKYVEYRRAEAFFAVPDSPAGEW